MIRDIEIRDRARRLGVEVELIQKDHVLNHVLAAIAESPGELVFRGGTALARVYWPDFRISEDLDFLTGSRLDLAAAAVEEAVRASAERTGLDLRVAVATLDSDMVRATVGWGEVQLAVDLNRAEQPAMPVERRELDLPYSDLSPEVRAIHVVALEEILANKWYMLDDRNEPRDLYDLWSGVCARDVSLDSVAEGFTAKYRARPSLWRIERARKVETKWDERLAHQINDLPSFDEVFGQLYSKVKEWEEAA